jgi:hypothetical protein
MTFNEEYFDRLEKRNKWNDTISAVPIKWAGPIVDVIDTFECVKKGLESIDIDDSFVLTEAVRMVIDRHDKNQSREEEL